MDLDQAKQELDRVRSLAKRSTDVFELKEWKRQIEELIEQFKPHSREDVVKPLYDDLQDVLIELVFTIETYSRRCKPF